ncbi:MAG: hypothetical protein ACR2ND_12725 [Solirubrobacteraceae bacterium]
MSVSQATRTLVKSAPELWAEISDPAALARHLEQFGEIKITRTDPERTVAWEGERASGTVELEVSGWGTKVRLTAALASASEHSPPAPGPPAAAIAAPEPLFVLPVEQRPVVPLVDKPASAAPPPPQPAPARPPEPKRRFLARMRSRRAAAAPARTTAPPAPPAPPVPPKPAPPAPPAPRMEPTRLALGAIRVLEFEPTPAVDASAQLESVLDVLGTAHRRPFSRG